MTITTLATLRDLLSPYWQRAYDEPGRYNIALEVFESLARLSILEQDSIMASFRDDTDEFEGIFLNENGKAIRLGNPEKADALQVIERYYRLELAKGYNPTFRNHR